MSDSTSPPSVSYQEYQAVVNQVAVQKEHLENLRSENRELKHNLHLLKRALFGSKSERFVDETNEAQGRLFDTELESRPKVEEAAQIEVKPHNRRRRKRYQDEQGNPSHFPPELPREEIVLEPEGVGECESCGKEHVQLSQKVTEKLCEVPAKYFVKRYIRPVYGCNCKACAPLCARAPVAVLPKSVLDVTFLGAMLSRKFAWHLPFNRQSQMLKELGIELSRDVLVSTCNKLTEMVYMPIVAVMLRQIIASELVQMDETPSTVAHRDSRGGTKYSKHSYYWPVMANGQVVFVYTGNRRHINVQEILGNDFKGVLLSDGYEAYLSYCKSHPEASLALCWDHARRKFVEVKDEEPLLAKEALIQLKELYGIERECKQLLKDEKLTPEKIPKYRKTHALPILNNFKKWCEIVRDSAEVLPKSNLFAACSYVINHWSGLTLYLNHGDVPLTNIKVEQIIRNLKLGTRNWLFAASEVGAQTVAVMNSLVCTCKMNGINVLEYLTDVLARAETEPPENLTPLSWAQKK